MAAVQQIQNVANLIVTIQVLDGTESVFPTWRSRLDNVLGFQNTLDIVKGTLPRPKDPAKAESSLVWSVEYTKFYSPSEVTSDWDALSNLAC
jgi:hypothetical protein